jgi:hypothetical protein
VTWKSFQIFRRKLLFDAMVIDVQSGAGAGFCSLK